MPRVGGEFVAPFPPVVPDTTIESAVHNGIVADFVLDANTARPITAGGTGATSAAAARTNLQAERAMATVTNYDSHVWENGSFWSNTGATAAPGGGIYSGVAYVANNDQNIITVEARDVATGVLYVRQKGTTWGTWKVDGSDQYVNTAGDTMTGNLEIDKANPVLSLNKQASGQANQFIGYTNSLPRWIVELGDNVGEGGSNTGSNFNIHRYNDVGAFLGTSLFINRQNGNVTLNGAVTGQLVISTHVTDPGFYLADTGEVSKAVFTHNISSGITSVSNLAAARAMTIEANGTMQLARGFQSRQGLDGGYAGFAHNFFWTGSATQYWVDTSNLGTLTITSDYRIKKDVIDLPGMWDTVKALRPIKYTQAQFSPPSHIAHMASDAKDASDLFIADDIERWGFIAHELQETLIESAATGVKDSPDTVQSPNPWTVIAALTSALQEAMARIEALEAATPL